MPTPGKVGALVAATSALTAAITAALARQASEPASPVAAYSTCYLAEQVFYSARGDTLYYVPPFGSRLRDSLIRADSTRDVASKQDSTLAVCTAPGQPARAVISAGFSTT